METSENRMLLVTDLKGDHYIKIKRIICMVAADGCCDIYYLNGNRKVKLVTGTRSMNEYLAGCCQKLQRLCRKSSVNVNHVIGLQRGRIVFDFDDPMLPTLEIPTETLPAVKELLRKKPS